MKETDIMGPVTRAAFNRRKEETADPSDSQRQNTKVFEAEFNRRKEATADPSASARQKTKERNFSVFDHILSEKMKKRREMPDM